MFLFAKSLHKEFFYDTVGKKNYIKYFWNFKTKNVNELMIIDIDKIFKNLLNVNYYIKHYLTSISWTLIHKIHVLIAVLGSD